MNMKTFTEFSLDEALDTHEMAMAHKDKASKALETSDMKSFHAHMANHHESMGQWHESKGRHSAADREYAKGEEHHEKSLKPDNSRTVGAKNESAICSACQSDPCICDDSHGFVAEAAKGHTIEAHGIRGMKGTPWRKTFKSHEHLSDWADKNDSVEVHATRELDGVKKKTNEEAELDEVFADQGSGSTAKDNAEYMKRRKAAGTAKHRVGVTVSEKDHPMVSKRLEKQQKFVKVSAGSKEEAVTKAKKFYSKQGYHVHGAEHHSVSEEVELQEDDTHAVYVNGRQWKTFSTKAHAENVAKKIKGATVHKYDADRLKNQYHAKLSARNAARGKEWDESTSVPSFKEFMEESPLDKFKKYTRPVVKTTPKMEKTTNPAGRTTDHTEWKVTTHTGEIHRYNSKKEAQAHFDSLPK